MLLLPQQPALSERAGYHGLLVATRTGNVVLPAQQQLALIAGRPQVLLPPQQQTPSEHAGHLGRLVATRTGSVVLPNQQQLALTAGHARAISEHADHRNGRVGYAGTVANEATVHLNAHLTRRWSAAHSFANSSGCRPRKRPFSPTLLKPLRGLTLPRFRTRPNSHHLSQGLERPSWPPVD